MRHLSTTLLILIGIVIPTASHGGATPAQRCHATLYKAAAKRTACAYKAGVAAVLKRAAPDYAPCEEQYARTFTGAYAKSGDACPYIDPDSFPAPPSSTVPVARCALTGQACTSDADCPATTVQGTCLSLGQCVYAPLDGGVTTAMCITSAGGTTTLAESDACRLLGDNSGCPAGARCLAINEPTCTSSRNPSNGHVCGTMGACASNADCALTGPNVCARCGDLAVQGNEECEFDRCASQCSPTCHFAGECLDIESATCSSPCATDADCAGPFGAFRCIPPTHCP
jgi:hypothetical protein